MSNAAENAEIVAGKSAAYGGAAGAFVSGITVSEWGVIGGLLIGVMRWACSQFWLWRKDRREEREMAIRMQHKFGTGWDEI